MTAFDILGLVGAAVGIVIATIVFLVVFFRSMAWLDLWIKGRSQIAVKQKITPPSPIKRRRRITNVQRPLAALKSTSASTKSADTQSVSKVEETIVSASAPGTTHDVTVLQSVSDIIMPDSKVQSARPRATVHLVSGEMVSGVSVLSKDHAERMLSELGLETSMSVGTVLFEDDGGRVFLVRSQNIKMLSWTRTHGVGATDAVPS
jgi:hypothetical protein